MRYLYVPAAQTNWFECQIGYDCLGWIINLQTELVACSRLAVVNGIHKKRVVAHAVQRSFTRDDSLIVHDCQGTYSIALEHNVASRPMLDVQQRALAVCILQEFESEAEVRWEPCVRVDDPATPCDESKRWIKNREYAMGRTGVEIAADAETNIINVDGNVVEVACADERTTSGP